MFAGMKNSIQIHDAKSRVTGTNKRVSCFKVRFVANNNEILQQSEPLESKAAVKKHLTALFKIIGNEASVIDKTKNQDFK
jgi:uncharacterized protein YegP (UPF0339 family)